MRRKFVSRRTTTPIRHRLFIDIAIALALTAILLGTIGIYNFNAADMHQVESKHSIEEYGLASVVLLAPTKPVPPGMQISQIELTEIHWPRAQVPVDAIRQGESVSALYAKSQLAANQPLSRANLSDKPPLGGLSAKIPKSYRATTIEVDASSGVESWAFPGTHVDMLVTYRDSEMKETKSQIFVENAVVMSYNGSTAQEKSEAYPIIGFAKATVTVAVPVKDAVAIHTARTMGRISLLLRNQNETKTNNAIVFSDKNFKKSRKDKPKKYSFATSGNKDYQYIDGKWVNVD